MFNHKHYVPILKWKRGERTALEKLDPTLKKYMTPLLEIQPIPFDHKKGVLSKTLDQHLQNVGSQVKSTWNQDSPVFVDVDTIYENLDSSEETVQSGQHPVEFVIDSIESNGVPVIPVTGLYRYQSFYDAILRVSAKYKRGICIRLQEEELSDLTSLPKTINDLLATYKISPKDVDLILDYKQILPTQEKAHVGNLILLLAQFPLISEWRTLTLASTAYPKTLQQIPTGKNGSIPRTEWRVYEKLLTLSLGRFPSFSDYNITHPDFVDLDPRLINVAAGIRYTYSDKFYIFRGVGVKNNGFLQMTSICQDIIQHQCYRGSTFSFGDKEIENCAHQTRATNGNLETWVTAGINHHLSLVTRDIASLP
ncbi:beta family protein [Lysinibacillus sp. 1 U-2021]|uniref:beta family protein n=1 Tax=Lysinibacillus sp. 1 U-2021 TaxID=3039426 RepID=UPI0024809F41|nr:beta family protein [Lysinibacillus sp. 1 U-2021]WGT39032.1 beta family protein [Lysinibacillus sp. 1 U-2021]